MKIYKITRITDIVYVTILKNKIDNTYSFVNLSKEHICTCKFKSENDALKDLRQQFEEGKIVAVDEIGTVSI
ncbi:MAG TPA: hypothetical protein DGR27_05225 [Eubacterium sp.]|nr:MAG TPA: hypothetical protein [Caudoviricetes sp.]HAS70601.1 hypothetical protein [Eubacterium sp.]HCW37902.1 hypothetical protein [Eubacterium sp.]